ncbi:hypothetical protein E2C01_080488 [Portunus trituberculatus]|uniref:Uncharacterized protein n=1 Tax=Portunus trituberculatus TaxID=210409 RepID=A0A5B7IZR6_PORTR|nr:hypothetical protein [Portunus trituberculatus]
MTLPDASEYVRYSTALMVTVGLGVSLLLLNGLIFLLLFWRRPSQHPTCQGHHLHAQEGADVPRVGSVMSLGGLGGTYGGPPDCVKASYEKLHLTSDELQHLTRQVPSASTGCPSKPFTPHSPLAPPLVRDTKDEGMKRPVNQDSVQCVRDSSTQGRNSEAEQRDGRANFTHAIQKVHQHGSY